MGAASRKPRLSHGSLRRFCFLVFVTVFGVILVVSLLRTSPGSSADFQSTHEVNYELMKAYNYSEIGSMLGLPKRSNLSLLLEKHNQLPPSNRDLHPTLPNLHMVLVLYVHNRPEYFKIVVESLSKVVGIGETLLIVSHDGHYPEMNEIVHSIRFCQVKQIFAPYSPHVFPDSFPGVSPGDCKEKGDGERKKCEGNSDQYGNYRSPKIVSLKHHWWWMMNTVWDGLKETSRYAGDVLFIEEDHFIFPNAYLNLRKLIELKPRKCPECFAVNLAPSDVKSRGENVDFLAAERMGNVGYAFNRTIWRKIHGMAKEFCFFDDYNWDIALWTTIFPSFGGTFYSLRGPRSSAFHFGKCGLHQGTDLKHGCADDGRLKIEVEDADMTVNINSDWNVHYYKLQNGYKAGFKGWGGWGDDRDRQLCMKFSQMYHNQPA